MEDLFKTAFTESVKQAPALTVLCIVVYFFLKAQKSALELLRSLHDEHIAARGESREAIKENTLSNREVTRAIMQLGRDSNWNINQRSK